jgi:TPR repeat protein
MPFMRSSGASSLRVIPILLMGVFPCGCVSWRAPQQKDPTDAPSQVLLGNRYRQGIGVSKDDEVAAAWYRKAALQGDPEGELNLGYCYARGEGLTKNEIEAARWYQRAADHGSAEAQYRLGICYERREGVPKNFITAYKWYNIAAASGHERAGESRDALAYRMTVGEITLAQRISSEWNAR